MSSEHKFSLACSRASRAFQTLGNALILAGDGAKFATAASLALAFESAVDAAPEKRRELVAAANEFIPIGLDAIKHKFQSDTISMLSRKLTRAVANFSLQCTETEKLKNDHRTTH